MESLPKNQKPSKLKLLSFNNAKTIKGESLGYRTAILYLAPDKESGVINTCKHSSKQCRALCLYWSGMSLMFKKVNEARVRKTKLMVDKPNLFWNTIQSEIDSLRMYCAKSKLHLYSDAESNREYEPAVRLNGTSDIWNDDFASVMWQNQDVQFYDYTKDVTRIDEWAVRETLPHNYHLTFSHSEEDLNNSLYCLSIGVNVAVVFATKVGHPLPKTWQGYEVIDGDEHDLRFMNQRYRKSVDIDGREMIVHDYKGVVIGLRAKGKAKKLKPTPNGFVNPSVDT